MVHRREGSPAISLGIAGLGVATELTMPTLLQDPRVDVAAVADPDEHARSEVAARTGARTYASFDELLEDRDIDAVYLATPHELHAAQACAALRRGKNVLVEKPIALTIEDGLAVVQASAETGRHVVVGHTHGFDPAVRAMREIIASGRLGPLAMITNVNYTSFLYRPRRPAELDTRLGGGIVFNQVPHQVDIARVLSGSAVRTVRAHTFVLDAERPTEGSHSTTLTFDNGAVATLIMSGYDYYDSDEQYEWYGESGRKRQPAHGAARRDLKERTADRAEAELRSRTTRWSDFFERLDRPAEWAHPHYGQLVVNLAGGDLRATPRGVMIYDETGSHEMVLPESAAHPDRSAVIDDLYAAAVHGRASLHDAAWGVATLEVCHRILDSSSSGCELELNHQSHGDAGRVSTVSPGSSGPIASFTKGNHHP